MLNQVSLIGNLGADPEVRHLNNGDKVANLRLAVSETWRDKSTGERKEKTEWINITIFGPLAGVAEQYLRKGSKVFVQGKFSTRKFTNRDGKDQYATEVVLQNFGGTLEMLGDPQGSRNDGGERSDRTSDREISKGDDHHRGDGGDFGSPRQTTTGGKFSSTDMDDEIPF